MLETIFDVADLTLDHEGGRVVGEDRVRAEEKKKIRKIRNSHSEVGRRILFKLWKLSLFTLFLVNLLCFFCKTLIQLLKYYTKLLISLQ